MTWLSSLVGTKSAISQSEMRGPEAWLYDLGEENFKTSSGAMVGSDEMLSLSAVFASAMAISEDVSTMPLKAFRSLPTGGKEVAKDEPMWESKPLGKMVNLNLLAHKQCNPFMTNMTFRSLLIWWATLYGNGFAEIKRDGGKPVSFEPIHPHRVEVKWDEDLGLWYDVREKEGKRDIWPEDMLHIKGPSNDGFIGDVINKRAKDAYGIYLSAERHTGSFFGRGATLAGVITFDQKFKDAEARRLYREEFSRVYGGAVNAGKWMLADQGAKVTPFSVDPERAQLVDTIKFRVEDVARWFRVPPVIIGHNTGTPYANIQPLGQFYYNFGLKPWAIRVEQEYDLKLAGDSEIFVEHIVDSLMWADPKTRTEVHAARIRIGMESPNEARNIENMNPYEGGDRFRVEQNLALIDENGEPVIVNQAPPNQPTGQQTGQQDTEAVKAAVMPAFVDAAERMILREAKAYGAKKNPDAAWVDSFYIGHRSSLISTFTPHAATLARLLGSSTDLNMMLEDYADKHVMESKRRLSEGENPVSWMTDRPAWIARHLTDEVSNA